MVMVWNSIASRTASACCSSALVTKSGWYTSPLGNGDCSGIWTSVRTLGNRLKGYEVHHDCRCTASGPDQVDPAGARLSRGPLPDCRQCLGDSRAGARDQGGGAMAFQITEVQKVLKGVDYPASKEELASRAERNGGGRELVDALRSMNADCFDGPNAVMKELKGSRTGSGG